MRQSEWVTRMARLAATEFGADWVINSDADEFWWPRGGSLKDVFATIPPRFGVVRGCWRHFVPRPDDGQFFAERMTVRLRARASRATRGRSSTRIRRSRIAAPGRRGRSGEPQCRGAGARAAARLASDRGPALLVPLGGPGRAQGRGGWMRNPHYDPALHQVRLDDALRAGDVDAFFDVARGLRLGARAGPRRRDARRRHAPARRAPAAPARRRDVRASRERLPLFPRPPVADDAAYAAEASVLVEIDGIVRAEQRVEALSRRLRALEEGPLRAGS